MPTKETDPSCNNKKLHIGNDYVTIVFNESGQEYNMQCITVRWTELDFQTIYLFFYVFSVSVHVCLCGGDSNGPWHKSCNGENKGRLDGASRRLTGHEDHFWSEFAHFGAPAGPPCKCKDIYAIKLKSLFGLKLSSDFSLHLWLCETWARKCCTLPTGLRDWGTSRGSNKGCCSRWKRKRRLLKLNPLDCKIRILTTSQILLFTLTSRTRESRLGTTKFNWRCLLLFWLNLRRE